MKILFMKNGRLMKRYFPYLAVSVCMLATLASCSLKEEDIDIQERITIYATHEDSEDTRTLLADGGSQVYWQPGDAVKLFRGTSSTKVTAAISSPARSAAFSGFAPYGKGDIIGLYPFSDESSYESGSINVTLPSTQKAVAGSFAPGNYITMGQTSTNKMTFYAVCGGFRFTLSENGVKSVIFEALNGESIAGDAMVSMVNGKPQIQTYSNSFSSITLTDSAGGYFTPGVWYYVVAFPAELSKGYKLTFVKDETSGSKEFNGAVTIKRSTFGSKKNVDSGVTFKDHEYVDLGLSVMWATYNVGATRPEQYGDYYAWGESEQKSDYLLRYYKWYNWDASKYTKYVAHWKYGTEDGKSVLEPEDDAAYPYFRRVSVTV